MLAVVATIYLLNAQPMEGPYPKSFECASFRADGHTTCQRVERRPIGRLQAEVWRIEGSGDIAYWIAMGSGDVWYRMESSSRYGYGCGLGHCEEKEPTRVLLAARADPQPIATLSIRATLTRTCNECVPRSTTRTVQTVEFACRMADDRSGAECGTPSTTPPD